MAISQTPIHVLRVLLQIEQNLVGLQRDMLSNANAWLAMANAQIPDAPTITQYMKDAASSYETRLGWILNYKNTSPNWNSVVAMYTALGGNVNDATTLYTQMKTVADGITNATLGTYASIITACNQIISAVNPPDSLWPE